MAACGPFERAPHVAVAVSGGADSLALMYLLLDWTREQGGRLTALTVDHGLRAESASEAARVAEWAKGAGIDHHVLAWRGEKPKSGLQAAAREARYRLMTEWCRANKVLHLVTAHQRDDQAETVAMRRARPGRGMGLAGMSAIATREGVRLLRPLLGVPGVALRRYLEARKQAWVEDPSNQLLRFERIRWRQGLEGTLPAPDAVAAWGRNRVAMEEAIADLFMRSVEIDPAGHVLIDLGRWKAMPPDLAIAALGRLVALVAGGKYPSASSALERGLAGLLAKGPVFSLGGTLIGSWKGRGLICREAAAVRQSLRGSGRWDGRFQVTLGPGLLSCQVSVLGEAGVAEIGQTGHSREWNKDIPPLARAGLPALRDATGRLILVPFLSFDPDGRGQGAHFRFLPGNSATGSGFTVAPGWPHTI
jgi:tRNA(Ile)-lysidine synthase